MTMATDGSSPLTRGKRLLVLVGEFVERLIPAHAGKTQVESNAMRTTSAHPRSRGENGDAPIDLGELAGSSPLTRGKLHAAKRGQ